MQCTFALASQEAVNPSMDMLDIDSKLTRRIDHKKELVSLITKLSYRYDKWEIFSDFVELSAISISNSADKSHWQERENRYLEIVKKYSKEELNQFVSMLGELVLSLEDEPTDVLGEVFHTLELHNKFKGQYFSPMPICRFLGEISAPMNGEELAEIVKRKGYINVCEPCSGSGAMIIGFCLAVQNRGINYQENVVVEATDIDLKCVHMTYLQLSLLGIPAVVIHGNSLSGEQFSRWYTPFYILGNWAARTAMETIFNNLCNNKEGVREAVPTMETEPISAILPSASDEVLPLAILPVDRSPSIAEVVDVPSDTKHNGIRKKKGILENQLTFW